MKKLLFFACTFIGGGIAGVGSAVLALDGHVLIAIAVFAGPFFTILSNAFKDTP